MASFRHSVAIPRPPEDVFPWLFEEDKVPQWTSRLEAYALLGDGGIGDGARIRQVLTVKGQSLEVVMVISSFDPPRAAESRFTLQGVDVVTSYELAGDGGGTELTQTLDAHASSFKARMLLPVVKPHLEGKLQDDLESLRGLLSG